MSFAPITITRTSNLISVTPVSYAPALIPYLIWYKQVRDDSRQSHPQGQRKAYYTQVQEPMFRQTEHELITFAGFRFKIYDLLSKYAPISVVDNRDPAWLFPQPNVDNLGAFKHGQMEALELVWKNDGGIIDCSTAWGKTEEIAKICASYADVPDYKIVIVGPGLDIVDTIRKRLAQYNIDSGQVGGGRDIRRQVTVCSSMSLMKLEDNGDLQNTRLCLFDEVHRCVAPTSRQALIRMNNARMFGLSATVDGRADKGEIVIEAFFGRRICTVTYQEAVANKVVSPMHVVMVETPGKELDVSDPTSKTRHGIWRNGARNQVFASIAAQLVEMGQVLILTQTLEHAYNIYKLLPAEWQLVYSGHPKTKLQNEQRAFRKKLENEPQAVQESFPRKPRTLVRAEKMVEEFEKDGLQPMTKTRRRQLADQFASGQIRGVVATKIWSTGVDFPQLQFVMRVDGSTSEIQSGQASGRASRRSDDTGKTVGIVIDGEDKFDDSLVSRRQARVRVYKRNGWTITRGARPEEVPTICQQILSG